MTSKYGSYMRKIIQIDLTAETVQEYPWTGQHRRRYLGGKIMANRILAEYKDGQHRKGIYPAILKAFGMQESPDTAMIYQNPTEAIIKSENEQNGSTDIL